MVPRSLYPRALSPTRHSWTNFALLPPPRARGYSLDSLATNYYSLATYYLATYFYSLYDTLMYGYSLDAGSGSLAYFGGYSL